MSQPSPDRESLQALLARVHERLNEAGSVDSGLARVAHSGDGGYRAGYRRRLRYGRREANSSRLEALAVRFEADHPSLAASLRRLIDLLGEVGI